MKPGNDDDCVAADGDGDDGGTLVDWDDEHFELYFLYSVTVDVGISSLPGSLCTGDSLDPW